MSAALAARRGRVATWLVVVAVLGGASGARAQQGRGGDVPDDPFAGAGGEGDTAGDDARGDQGDTAEGEEEEEEEGDEDEAGGEGEGRGQGGGEGAGAGQHGAHAAGQHSEEASSRTELPAPGLTVRHRPPPPPEEGQSSRLVLPPLLIERQGDVHTTALFPFFYSRTARRDRQLIVGLYYQRRGEIEAADVVFPMFWSFRGQDYRTWSIPPVYYHSDHDGYDLGAAPLFFTGKSGDDVYTVIPPLLTASWADREEAYTFAGPFWRLRDHEDVDWGVFPLLWVHNTMLVQNIIGAPLFFRFVDYDERSALTIVPPFYHRVTEQGAAWGAAPLLFHSHDQHGSSLTIPPLLFHYSYDAGDTRLWALLFGYFHVDNATTLITPLYQLHRGDTELDAVAPIFFSWRDPREGAASLLIPPLFYHHESPAETATVVFPLFGHWQEPGRYTTWATPLLAHWESHTRSAAATWIFPTFQFSHSPDSGTFNLHPLVYSTSARKHRHLVLAPLYWDFEDYEDHDRTSILFPLLWRFRDGATVSQLAGNVYFHSGRRRTGEFYEVHIFPFFSYGSDGPDSSWWNVLYGLVGYQRQGRYARARLFWVPFQTDGP